MKAKFCREVGDHFLGLTGVLGAVPTAPIGAVLVEQFKNGGVLPEIGRVFRELGESLGFDIGEEFHRIMMRVKPERRINRLEQLTSFYCPAPPQVVREFGQSSETCRDMLLNGSDWRRRRIHEGSL